MRIAHVENGLGHEPLFRVWLEEAGFEVESFLHAELFLARAEELDFDAILMDWQVPDAGAIHILTYLRRRLASTSCILFLCLDSDELGKVRILQAGADDCIAKPVGRFELVTRLDALQRRATADYVGAPIGFGENGMSLLPEMAGEQSDWVDPHQRALHATRLLR